MTKQTTILFTTNRATIIRSQKEHAKTHFIASERNFNKQAAAVKQQKRHKQMYVNARILKLEADRATTVRMCDSRSSRSSLTAKH
jgi:vancomycin permeability regulator SanA